MTEEGLDFWGLLSGEDLNSDSVLKNPKEELPNSSPLKHCMAACHSLTTIDGEFIGDPLDIKMFEVRKYYVYKINLIFFEEYWLALQRKWR